MRHRFSLKVIVIQMLLFFFYFGESKGVNFQFNCRVIFACVNRKEAIYERPHVNVKGERGSTIAFTRYIPYIASIYLCA